MKIDELKMRVWRGNGAAAARAADRTGNRTGNRMITTGFPALDRFLPGGGWPIGAITEVFVEGYGIGELTLLMPALRALTREGGSGEKKWVAWIAPPFVPYAPALEQHGIDANRILMIHPSGGDKNRLWATEQVVRSGSSCAVLAWIAVADDVMLRRMQLAAEDRACWILLFRPERIRKQRSPAALRIVLSQHAEALRVQVLKCRGGRPGIVDLSGPSLGLASSGVATGAFS